MFVGQVPVPGDFTSVASTFGNQNPQQSVAPRGGDLFILYPDGTLKNVTRTAGFGGTGFQGSASIAVREPCVHWDGTKALFSMVVGSASTQFQVKTFYWQIYEVTHLGKNETPVITKVANQPANFNNISPIYGTDGRIIFTTDRPRTGEAHLYPQLDEYEEAPTVTGIWSLNPINGDLRILNHTPSGAFGPQIDSYGRLIFTRWDHLQRDQQADADADEPGTYGTFDYSDETAGAQKLNQRVEVFPEPRADALPGGTNLVGNSINHFFPWAMNEDGTTEETINHIGRHELHNYFNRVFTDDPALDNFSPGNRFNTNEVENTFQLREDPLNAGLYYGTDSPEFTTHASGQIVSFSAPPSLPADQIQMNWITARSTRDFYNPPDTAPGDDSGHYRDPLPLSDGTLIAAHTAETRSDGDDGTDGHPQSRYDFRLKTLVQQNGFYVAGTALTSGIAASISFWTPDSLVQWSGNLWELYPVEVRPRPVPNKATTPLETAEQTAFTSSNVDPAKFRQYLKENDLALIVMRDVTTRDKADIQQPYNLRVPGGVSHIVNMNQKVYDVSRLQLYQADQLRGLYGIPDPQNPNLVTGGREGRRVLARRMHDTTAVAVNPPSMFTQSAGTTIASDGSVAAFVPAHRAMSWHMVDPNNVPVVRERYWLTFQPGEVRVCASCHGINTKSQLDQNPPTNVPAALTTLLQYWKSVQDTLPPVPANLNAAATTPTSVGVSWSASAGATQYEVARSAGSDYSIVKTTSSTSFSDPVSANTTYLYKVRAVGAAGTSLYSAPDVATTILFTDDPIVPQSTRIKAVHFTEMRQALAAMRTAAGLEAASYTNTPLTSLLTVKVADIQQMRTALAQARAALSVSALTFTDPTLTPGTSTARAVHLQELRSGVK